MGARSARDGRTALRGSAGLLRWALRSALPACLVLTLAGRAGALSESEIYDLWAKAARQFEATHTIQAPDSDDSRWARRIGERIVSGWPDRQWVSHSFLVVESSALGAWSFPVSPVQHRVYVTSGLLAFIRERGGEERDDQLAGVLAHEIAHLMRDHHLERQRRAQLLQTEAPRVLGEWQQEDELEADRYGAFYALHAGFRFDGMVHFLASYLRHSGNRQHLDAVAAPGGRVHPTLTARIASLRSEQARIEEAEEVFQWGLDLLRVGAWEAARDCFVRVRSTFMLSPTVVYNLGYAELKQYEASLPAGPPLAQCVATDYASQPPKGAAAAPERGLLVEAKGDFIKACELDREGRFPLPRLGLTMAYLYEGEDGKAQVQLQEVKMGTAEPAYLNLLGVLAERRDDGGGALRAYCRTLGLPVHATAQEAATEAQQAAAPYLPALYNLARLLEHQGSQPEAAQLYRRFLTFEGSLSFYGIRARDGLLRCKGRLPSPDTVAEVTSYQGMDLRTSGMLVVKAALGEPESQHSFPVGRGAITVCEYPAQGVTVVLAPGLSEEPVVTLVALSEPNRDLVAGVRLGDSADTLTTRLGSPRSIRENAGSSAWWDYGRYGLALQVEGGKVTRCLIGRRR